MPFAPNLVDASRAFNGPAFAGAVRDIVRDVRQKRLAQLQAVLDANARGDRSSIVRIVESIMEDERCQR